MDVQDFTAALRHLEIDDIEAAAADLEVQASSVAGEVLWWRATVEIDRQLRARHAGRLGAQAAYQASAAVLAAAADAGISTSDPRVIAVARAAADVARGLVVHASAADVLLNGCRHLVAA